jgi:transcriptional regulator with XRE-family HTH domain
MTAPDVRMAQIGARIRDLRKDRGLRQADLAQILGLSRSSVANIEAGRQGQISLTHLQQIADALGGNVTELATTSPAPWLELARRNNQARMAYEEMAAESWRSFDVVAAVRYRGVAEGLDMAQSHQVQVVRESGGVA